MIYLNSTKDIWYCTKCTIDIFPLNVIEDDLDYKSAIEGISFPPGNSFCYLSDKLFIPFELNDKDHASELRDADPDFNFHNITNGISAKCNYYLESSFNEEVAKANITNEILSLCHTNIRSMRQNLSAFENYMQLLDHQFTVIGFTETWLQDDSHDLYGLKGYHFIGNHRANKTGGGVAICLKDHIDYTKRSDLSHTSEDMESVFIEIVNGQMHTKKDIIIGVIYRPHNSDMGAFIEKPNELTESLKLERKVCYLLGDFNINLLNYETHAQTGSFFDMLSSDGFLPLITRPTRVTATSGTLIDNIFTNNLIDISISFQGLLVTDIRDHYPVFHIDHQTCMKEAEVFVYKRLFSSKHKNDFYHALSVTDWNEIYRASDTQCAYDLFHDHLLELYNKHFPKIRTKKKYNNR